MQIYSELDVDKRIVEVEFESSAWFFAFVLLFFILKYILRISIKTLTNS